MHKLDDAGALNCGAQLLGALERIRARHGWSEGDLIAVCAVAMTELVGRAVGPVRTAEFFRGHADELEREHRRRATT
jgi:hypothetical protein